MKDCVTKEELLGLPELDTERVSVRLLLMDPVTVGLVESVPQAVAEPDRDGETVLLLL